MGRLKAIGRIFREARCNQIIERRRTGGLDLCNRLRILFENCAEHAELRLAVKGLASGDHLIEHAAETEDVAASVGFAALKNFRCHVLKRADDRSLLRKWGGG